MTLPIVTTNRYQQLLAALPTGTFYDAAGYIIPYRSGQQQFRLETGTANRSYNVFVNQVLTGVATSNNDGVAIVSLTLLPGRSDIQIVDTVTQQAFNSFIDSRRFATWYASYADIFETSDAEIEDIYNARSLDTVSSNYAEAVYGKNLAAPNSSSYSNVSYVNLLQELRQAYRGYGGIARGLRVAIGGFTSSVPWDVPSFLYPQWILGFDLCPNGQLQDYVRTSSEALQVAGLDLPNINQVSLSYVIASIVDTNIVSTFTPTNQPPVSQLLTLTTGAAWAGGNITILGIDPTGQVITEVLTPVLNSTITSVFDYATVTSISKAAVAGAGSSISIGVATSRFVTIEEIGSYNEIGSPLTLQYDAGPDRLTWNGGDSVELNFTVTPSGQFVLTDPDLAAALYGIPQSPFNIDPLASGVLSSQVDQLYLSYDNGPTYRVDLSSFAPSISAANVVATVNATLPSPIANVITGTEGVNGHIVQLLSPTTGLSSDVKIEVGAADASPAIFGMPRERTTLASNASIGASTITVTDASVFPPPSTAPITAKFVTTQIQGVSLGAPSVNSPLGLGQLRLIISSSIDRTLAYAAPGDTLGTAIQVGVSGGAVTLSSNNVAYTIDVIVNLEQLNASTTAQTLTDTIQLLTPGEFDVRIRGRRFNATNGSITAGSPTTIATFVSATAAFSALDVGGVIRVSGSAHAGNNGLHTIIAWTNATTVTIRNAGYATATAFTTEGSRVFSLFAPGEVHTVTSIAGNVLHLLDTVVRAWPGNVSVYVEMAQEAPSEVDGLLGPGTLKVLVDPTFTPPSSPQSDPITPVGQDLPDGWLTTGVNTTYQSIAGYLDTSRLVLRSTSVGDMRLYRHIPGAEQYIGLPLRVAFWIQEHSSATVNYRIDVSIDGGVNWLLGGSTTAVTGTVLDRAPPFIAGSLQPVPVRRTFYIPTTATSVWVRLVRVNDGANPATFSVHRVIVDSLTHTALFTGSNTIPRSAQRANFRELIYVWSPEPLNTDEDAIMGLTPGNVPPYTTTAGQFDLIMPAHETIERFDVSEYDGSDLPVNLFGVYTDNDWISNATLTNMEIVVGTPARLTYARPTRVGTINGELLAFTAGVGGVDSTTLTQTAAFEGTIPPGTPNGDAILMEISPTYDKVVNGQTISTPTFVGDILAVPDTPDAASVQPWNWISGNRIHVNNAYFDSSADYYLTYDVLMRAESSAIHLTGSITDYAWMIDVGYFTRIDLREGTEAAFEQLIFRGDYTATLSSKSNLDLATSILTADDGLTKTQVAQADWSYLDSSTVKISSAVFNPLAIYSFSYTALFPDLYSPATVTIEWRSATTAPGLTAANYQEVSNNEIVNPVDVNGTYNAYHQIRVTISGVVDVRDVRIYSLGLKGVHLFGGSSYAPGIIVE